VTWAITGGSGQLGTALREMLSVNRTSFRSFTRDDFDITKVRDIDNLQKANPSVIINCSAWTDVDGAELHPEEANSINSRGVKNLSNFARSLGIPLIHISTDYVFSGKGDLPWKTSDETNPINSYGRSKLQGERTALECYPDGTYIVRTSWLYSPWRKNFAKTMTRRALEGLETKVVSDQTGRPTSAIDLAEQIYKLITFKESPGIYHFANSGRASWFDFAQEIYKLVGADLNLLTPISTDDFPSTTGRPKNSVLELEGSVSEVLPLMADWRKALGRAFPRIVLSIKREPVDG